MQIDEIIPGVLHVNFPTQLELTRTFIRFEELSDAHGKVTGFTADDYLEQYRRIAAPEAQDYYTYWEAFFVSSKDLEPFYNGSFEPLTEHERVLLAALADRPRPFALLGTFGDEYASHLRHELAHVFWGQHDRYRRAVSQVLATMPAAEHNAIITKLVSLGYDRNCIEEEIQAYIVDGMDDLRGWGIDTAPLAAVHDRITALYEDCFSQCSAQAADL